MPRSKLIRTNSHPYHITIRCNNKEWFDLPMSQVWSFSKKSLMEANLKHPVKIQAFVLMSNHYHLLIWTPNANIDQFMFEFNSRLSKRIRKKTGRVNRIFGDRYKWSVITSKGHYINVLKYVYQNPLQAEIVKRCEQYPYSSLHYVFSHKKFSTELYHPIYGEMKDYLQFINELFSKDSKEAIKKALGHSEFKIPPHLETHQAESIALHHELSVLVF